MNPKDSNDPVTYLLQTIPRLGKEFGDRLHRADGPAVAKSLHDKFHQDDLDWFGRRVWPYFSHIPLDRWPQKESTMAHLYCRNVVGFFQSVRGATVATERGYVPNVEAQWYTDWLLRLTLGDDAAKQAKEGLLPQFKQRDLQGQLRLFTAALSTHLPEFQEQFSLLYLYTPTLDLRVQATTVRAFGDTSQAEKLHAEAFSREGKLDGWVSYYWTGGAVCYVLESDQGVLAPQLPESGRLFFLWTQAEQAKEFNEWKYGGKHRITRMDYRELAVQLERFQSAGKVHVILDQRMNDDMKIFPVADFLQHVQNTINAADTSEFGKAMKAGLEK
jgi:hypothetical protein